MNLTSRAITVVSPQQNSLIRWCRLNFAEAFTSWVHLKAIRTFIEAGTRIAHTHNRTRARHSPQPL